MVESVGGEQQCEQLRTRESAVATALHRGSLELRFEAVRQKIDVKLPELIFRIPVSIKSKHQTDYYP